MAGGCVGAGVSVGMAVSKVAVGIGVSLVIGVSVATTFVVELDGDDFVTAFPIAPQRISTPTIIPRMSQGFCFFLGGRGGGGGGIIGGC